MIDGSYEHGKWINFFLQFSERNSEQVGIRTKLFLGLFCEWLVLPSDEFGNGFRGRKIGAVLTKHSRSEGMAKWSVQVIDVRRGDK